MIDRRAALVGIGVLLAAPLGAVAQQVGKMWRVGLFHVGVDHVPPSLDGLRDRLKTLRYEEGKNIRLDWRNLVDEDAARATAQAFVRDRVDLIVAFENQTVRAIQATTTEIPVVMLHVPDPVADGFVKSLARPGGNITGFAGLGNTPAKEMEIFKELVPQLRRPLVLFEARDPASPRWLAEVRRAATTLKLQAVEGQVASATDLEQVFAGVKPGEVDGVFIASPDLRTKFPALILDLATKRRLPLAANRKEWVEGGALFSYNDNLRAVGRAAAARYVDRILKGAKPADLPVEEVTQFELIINLKTAKALGLTVPPSLLARADQVIE
jgi:putative ABC transport system substrate-binding protein